MEIRSSSRFPVVTAAGDASRVTAIQEPAPEVELVQSGNAHLAGALPESGRAAGGIERRVEINPATQDVVFQAIDQRNGEVVRQYPDQAILRLRAYLHAATIRAIEPEQTNVA